MIEIFITNFFLFIIINRLNINSLEKILINLSINILVLIINFESYETFIENLIFYFSLLFIILNVYTMKYSSLRFMILKKLHMKKNIPSEIWLYRNREKRIKLKKSFMRYELFYVLNFIVNMFKKISL